MENVASLRKRLLFLTGDPGVGKTTVLLKTVEVLKSKGYSVGGMVSREVRDHGNRIGFEILDLNSGKRGWLAHTSQKTGPSIGRYRVNLNDLENVGVTAIVEALKSLDIIIIDEIGPMELTSPIFKTEIERIIESKKLVIGVVHRKARDSLVDEVKKRDDAQIFVVTHDNRNNLHKIVVAEAIAFLAKTSIQM